MKTHKRNLNRKMTLCPSQHEASSVVVKKGNEFKKETKDGNEKEPATTIISSNLSNDKLKNSRIQQFPFHLDSGKLKAFWNKNNWWKKKGIPTLTALITSVTILWFPLSCGMLVFASLHDVR